MTGCARCDRAKSRKPLTCGWAGLFDGIEVEAAREGILLGLHGEDGRSGDQAARAFDVEPLGVAQEGEGRDADAVHVRRHRVGNFAGGEEELGRAGERQAARLQDLRLEAAEGARALAHRVDVDLARRQADLRPVGDLAREDLGDAVDRQRHRRIVLGDDDDQAVQPQHVLVLGGADVGSAGADEPGRLLVVDGPRGHADLRRAVLQRREGRRRSVALEVEQRRLGTARVDDLVMLLQRIAAGERARGAADVLRIGADQGRHEVPADCRGAVDADGLRADGGGARAGTRRRGGDGRGGRLAAGAGGADAFHVGRIERHGAERLVIEDVAPTFEAFEDALQLERTALHAQGHLRGVSRRRALRAAPQARPAGETGRPLRPPGLSSPRR